MANIKDYPQTAEVDINLNTIYFTPGKVKPYPLVSIFNSSSILPIGTIIAYAGIMIPSGFLLCDGSQVSRRYFPALFSVIGVGFGIGDGITTFAVPDLRGMFLRGSSLSSGRDTGQLTRKGTGVGSIQQASVAYHTHNMQFDTQSGSAFIPVGQLPGTQLSYFLVDPGNILTQKTTLTTTSGVASEVASGMASSGDGTGETISDKSTSGNISDKDCKPTNIYVTYIIAAH